MAWLCFMDSENFKCCLEMDQCWKVKEGQAEDHLVKDIDGRVGGDWIFTR